MSTASPGRAPAKAFFHPGYCTRALSAAHHQLSAPYHLPRRSRKEPSASKNRRIFLRWPEDTWGQLIFFFYWGWCWLSGRSFAAPLVSSVKIPAALTTIPTPQSWHLGSGCLFPNFPEGKNENKKQEHESEGEAGGAPKIASICERLHC